MITPNRSWITRYGVVAALIAMSVIATIVAPGFFSIANASTILLHVSINGILTLGMTFVIITAGIDLSVGSLLGPAGGLVGGALTAPRLLPVGGDGGGGGGATLDGAVGGAG